MQALLCATKPLLAWQALHVIGQSAGAQTALLVALAIRRWPGQLLGPPPQLARVLIYAPAVGDELLRESAALPNLRILFVFCDGDQLCPTDNPARLFQQLQGMGIAPFLITAGNSTAQRNAAKTYAGSSLHNLREIFPPSMVLDAMGGTQNVFSI